MKKAQEHSAKVSAFKFLLWTFITLLLCTSSFAQSTSWKGTTSTLWTTAANWTNGVPSATVDAIIGDASFTSTRHPSIGAASTCKSLLVGGSVAATLAINKSLTVSGNITITGNGTITQAKNITVSLKGNWSNSGTYTPGNNTPAIAFSGVTQAIGGTNATAFRKVTINSGSTVTLNTNISVSTSLTINGTFIPTENATPYLISGTGTLVIGAAGIIKVNASAFAANYGLSGAKTLSAGSTVEYSATTINQTINNILNTINYSTLKISGALTKTLAENLQPLNSTTASTGNILVASGTLDLSAFTADRGTTVAGGTFTVSNGAFLRLSGASNLPLNFATKTFSLTSTVEYYGDNQTVVAQTYGNLLLTGLSGAVVKTMPSTTFTIAGNFTSTKNLANTVSYTAASNIFITGNINIGASTTFNASTFAHQVTGNWINNGTLAGGTSTFTLNGSGTSIGGSGVYSFNDLTVSASGNSITANTNITVGGNLITTGAGSLIHNSPGTFTMSGTTKSIAGSGMVFDNLTCSGTISTSSNLTINGNLSVAGSLTSTAGNINLTGNSKSISGSGTINLYALKASGNITTTSSFTLSTSLDVSGSLTATAGTATFTGSNTLNGIANLFNVTLNGTSLQLSTNAVLGIANLFTITAGTLNVTSTSPNTVNYNGSGTQNIIGATYHHLSLSNGNIKTATGALTVNGNFSIAALTTFAGSAFTHALAGNWINSGTFTPDASTINLSGSSNSNISGTSTFNILTINKSSSVNVVTLLNNISVPLINMTSGTLQTGINTLTITNTRNGNGIILGNIQRTHAFTPGVSYAFEGAENTITFLSVTGVNTITVKATKGSIADFPFGGSVNRLYDITIAGMYIATLRLHYEDDELNGNSESGMQLWKYDGAAWAISGKTASNATSNYVEQTGLTSMSNRFTISDNANVAQWNGSVSTDWFTAGNWSTVQGSPSLPPGANDIVEIGTTTFNNQPTINNSASIKNISLGSAKAVTLSLVGSGSGVLTAIGNISGTWSANITHNVLVNNQTITVNGNLALSDGINGHAINLSIGTGTVNVLGSLIQSGGANITFTGAGNINIGTDFNYTNGTFTPGTGTVQYNGAATQVVAGIGYNNITINKTAGTASLNSPASVAGNVLISAGLLDLNADLNIAGNVTIATGASLNSNSYTSSVGGNWVNNGNFIASNGGVIFNGTGLQTISPSTFDNLTINKTSGTAVLSGNSSINGNLAVNAGTFDLSTFTSNRNSAGGSFIMLSGTTLKIAGANNFPLNFGSYTINANSTTEYNGMVAQSVAGNSYGNLILSNGGSNVKTLLAAIVVSGNITINSGAALTADVYSIDLFGNWLNSGTFNAGTSVIMFQGTNKTITGNTTFFRSAIYGSYTSTGSDVTFNSTFRILTGASFDGTTSVLNINGDFTNSGSILSNGILNFSGTVVQTIRLLNAPVSNSSGIVNFNGTFSPILNSTSAPTFATLNINNTGGINPSVDWSVFVAFNISIGATFNGGLLTHNIYGGFTNNGTVTSNGTLNFSPSSAKTYVIAGTNFNSTGTVIFGGSGAVSFTGIAGTLTNVTISNTAGVTPNAGWNIGGDLAITALGIFNAGSFNYTVAKDINSSGTLNGGTSTFTMSGAAGQISGSTTTTFYHFITTGTTITANIDFNVSGNLTTTGTLEALTGSVIFTGSGNSTVNGATTPFALFSVAKTSGAVVTLARNVTNASAIDIVSGTLDASNYTITQDGTPEAINSLLIRNGGALKIAGTNTLPAFTTYGLDSLSTVEYAGGTQSISSISALSPYGNLIISTAGSKAANGSLNIRNNFTLTNGTFVAGSYIDTLGGNWSMASGAFTNTGSSFLLNGTGTQDINYTGAFNHLTIAKTAGIATLSTNATINGILTFTSGNIQTGAFTVIIPSTGSVAGAAQTTGWVNGKLQKNFATGSNVTRTFEVGGSVYYSPATVVAASVTTAGNFTANATPSDHTNLSASGINVNKSVNRFFTLTNSGIGFTTATATFNWVASDVDAGANTANFKVKSYNGSVWTLLAVTSPLATSIQATGITSFSDFAIGELATLTNWTGSVSTDWNNSGNWSSGVPTTNSNISIPAPLTNYPVLNSGTGSVQNIIIQIGASLTVSTATLQISGTINNIGTFTSSNGTIEMNGTSAQTIPAATFLGNTINELIVNNLAGVTLNGTLNLTGFLRVNAGQLNTGNFLVLKSSVTGTATVARIMSIAADPINGDVTVERFIPGRRKYRLITSSVTTSPATTLIAGQESKSIWGNWQNGGNNIAGIGSFITGGTIADGFDQQVIPASLFTYNPDTKKYVGFTSANLKNTKLTPLNAGQAYYMYVFGDRINSVYAAVPNATVLNATGKLTTGDQTYTTSSAMPLNSTTGNFTLLGNPFASVIDWATISRTNLANTYWGWDPNLDNNGGYVTVNTTGAVTLISPYTGTTGLTQYIQPGQGFFVKTMAASPVLNIREQDKVANTSNAAFRQTGANNISLLAVNLFYNKSGSQLFADGALAAFDESFVNEVAKEDASKMSGSGESVSIAEGAQLLSIDGRKLPMDTDTLRLNITRLTRPQYTLQIFAKQMEGGNLQAFVQDQYLKTSLPLSLADTNKIVFNITADSSSFSNNRFSIVFSQNSVLPVSFKTIDVVKKEKFANVKWSVATEEGIEKYEIERSLNGVDFKKLGEVVAIGNSTQIISYTWLDIMPALGMNYYRIRSVSNDAAFKISKIVNVFFEGAKSSIVVYPNPVVNQDINLQLHEIKQGRYTLILYSSNGMVVAHFDFNHSGSTFQRIQIKTKVPAGIYYFKIEGPDFKSNQQVIFK